MITLRGGGRAQVVRLGELVMILDLAREGLSVSAIARRTGLDRKTIRKYIARGLEAPAYTARPVRPTLLTPFEPYLRERLQAFPDLSARRLLRELKERGYTGGYTILKAVVRAIRPTPSPSFERRFETPPGKQAQVDFAFFKTTFTDEPEAERIVWLFSMVLGHSRMMWARFVARQDLQTVLRCHIAAFDSFGGVPEQILYDRMKTAVLGDRAGRDRRPRSADPRHRLQSQAPLPGQPLRFPAEGLQAVPRQDQGQSRTALPLCARGLLPGPQLPQSR